MNSLNPFSFIPLLLHIITKTTDPIAPRTIETSQGTGFLYEKDNIVYLITNRHVITERDCENNILPYMKGGIPTQVEFMFSTCTDTHINKFPNPLSVPLYTIENKPKWLVHPNYKIDIVALPLGRSEAKPERLASINNTIEFTDDMVISVAEDVFIVGYPYGRTSGERTPLPIWKRATIASEPTENYYADGRKTFLIDTTTRSGMSGSPVIIYKLGTYMTSTGTTVLSTRPSFKFLGVYSGRIDGDRELDSYLGIVWKKELIDEIIDGGKIEDNPPCI